MSTIFALVAGAALVVSAFGQPSFRIVTLDPGHFHAGLIQKEMSLAIEADSWVYAPLGSDLNAHLNRIAQFNARKENPTRWKEHIYAAPDYYERMLAEHPGNVVVLSGANRGKIQRIGEIAGRGMHALADKPWIINAADLPALESALDTAAKNKVIAYDGMTQRFEITCILQKELVNDAGVFGKPLKGSADDPAVYMESVHYLLKLVAGVPNLRPAWFFDIRQQGEGLADVGTHLVDQVQWILTPEQQIDLRRDIQVLSGKRWPTQLTLPEYQRVTGEKDFPEYLKEAVRAGKLDYYCNNSVNYTLRGSHVKLDVKWDYEPKPGTSDTELAIFKGGNSRVEIRQGKDESYRPEVYVVPNNAAAKAQVKTSLERKLATIQAWPGVTVADRGERLQLVIPDKYRIGHEAHFALLVGKFLEYARNPQSLPAWEKSFMTAKYFVTTNGVLVAK